MSKIVHFRDNQCLIGYCDSLKELGSGWWGVIEKLEKENKCQFISIVTVEFREGEEVCAFLEFTNSFYHVAHVSNSSYEPSYGGGDIEKAYQLFGYVCQEEILKRITRGMS